MAAIKIPTFGGLFPQVSPRLLPDTAATIASNARLDTGRLSSWRAPLIISDHNNAIFAVPGTTKTIFKHRDRQGNGYWLIWNTEVHAVPSPIAEDPWDRLYWTGQTFPRMAIGTEVASSAYPSYQPSSSRKLGVTAPAASPVSALTTDGTDDSTPLSRSYLYAWVSGLGEEGQPSPASNILEVKSGGTVTLTFAESAPSYIYNTGGQPARRRIYRTNINGEYQFVADIASTATTYADNKLDENLGELVPTAEWDAPPDDNGGDHPDGPMIGLTAMPNGMLAGFSGRSVFFAEQYLPHAWPRAYSLTTKSKVVGLSSISIGLMVMTQGKPVLMTGSAPGGMSAVEIDSNQACVSTRSIADMGEIAIYASPDGLVAAGENGVQLITEGIFTRDQWQALKPESIHGYHYEGRYIFFYDTGTVKGGYVMDGRSQTPELVTLDFHALAGFNDPLDDALYLLVTDVTGTNVRKFDAGALLTYTWQSKELRLEKPINPSCAIVDAEAYPVTFTIYADGVQKYQYAAPNGNMFRLPAGYLAKEFQLRLSGTGAVNAVMVAESPEEFQ